MKTTQSPVEWCERMRDNAKTGEEAYHYHQLAELYKRGEQE